MNDTMTANYRVIEIMTNDFSAHNHGHPSQVTETVKWSGTDLDELSRQYPPSDIFGADPLGHSEIEDGLICYDYRFERQSGDGSWEQIDDPRRRITPMTDLERAIDADNRRDFPGDYYEDGDSVPGNIWSVGEPEDSDWSHVDEDPEAYGYCGKCGKDTAFCACDCFVCGNILEECACTCAQCNTVVQGAGLCETHKVAWDESIQGPEPDSSKMVGTCTSCGVPFNRVHELDPNEQLGTIRILTLHNRTVCLRCLSE